MKLAIVGCRDYNNKKFIFDSIKKEYNINEITCIISGGCSGVDNIAEEFARENNIKTIIYKPNWKLYGRAAGPIRNKLIIEDCDQVLAFWDNKSKGTKSSIDIANSLEKKIIIKYI